ncbi:MAG: ferrochelatase [Burkholderiales bacterium]|nr:ferrochelatase [Burkholderiales bacterium]
MPRYLPEPAFSHGDSPRIGVLLVNLGTPDAATPQALRRYLAEFLWDPRVVEIPRAIWWFILNLIILPLRPRASAAKYASIWSAEGSPLRVHTERVTEILKGRLQNRFGDAMVIDYAMRYGRPSVSDAIASLRVLHCDRLLVIPMYPQFAGSTTASVCDAVFDALKARRVVPELRVLRNFHDRPDYIAALAASIREYWDEHGEPDCLMMSFHGVPRRSLDLGDMYHCECHKTGRLVAQRLGLAEGRWKVCFQSRFGKAEWLKPYTAPTLVEMAEAGVGRVDVVCPGFVADCLETLEEIAMEGREEFLEHGGREYHYIPCLNQREDWIDALERMIGEQTADWCAKQPGAQALAESRAAALAIGAED